MAKVLLVEDDNNLREIFEMRLLAEGYDTVTAGDGEEALVVATKEKPSLIIADVMMPKLSGFEMLETMRSSPGMADTKVVLMTALGQAEDRARGEKLGVVKYLVKSQVTLEDFVRAVREVMPPDGQAKPPTEAQNAQLQEEITSSNKKGSEQSMQDDTKNSPTMPPTDGSGGASMPSGDSGAPAPAGGQMSSDQEKTVVNDQVNSFAASAPAETTTGGSSMPPASDGGMPQPDPMPTTPPAEPGPQPPAEEPKPDMGTTMPPAPGV